MMALPAVAPVPELPPLPGLPPLPALTVPALPAELAFVPAAPPVPDGGGDEAEHAHIRRALAAITPATVFGNRTR